jgi:O-methyltransferase
MRWRGRANALLRTMTGYELTKANLRAKAPPRGARAGSRRSQKYALRSDYDQAAKETIKAVRRRTMTSSEKLFGLISAVRYVVRHDIPGEIVECGVWRGGSMQAVARTLVEAGVDDRDLYLFDTFEGMPPPSEADRRYDGRSAAVLLAESKPTAPVWAVASLEDVQAGMDEVGYPADRIHYVKGLVEDTVPREAPERIAILRLDTDWYESTRHELEHLYPRLASGGILIIDDYGWWQGSRQAVDEFLQETDERLLLLRLDRGRIAVKP